ncbi:hypothetical protein B0H14DRAFT_2633038 [Mycena olivaceomarginata]|nr:hypothetical protein B0H14DRAFT_2633038 [Mycena olivaceomarginata]
MHYAPPIFPILPWATSAFLPPFVPQQNSNSYPTAAYKGEFVLSSIDTRNAPPTLIPNPRNVAASTSSMFTSLAQEDSALNRSAANPYSYPMTQIFFQPSGNTNSNYNRCTVYSTCRTNFLFLSSETMPSTHAFGIIGVRDCGLNWPRPEPSSEEKPIASPLALC